MTDSIRVLHVDDDPEFVALAATFLERADGRLDVDTAPSAGAALERLEAEAFDCLVTDYHMPEVDGIELLEVVRERFPALPVVLFTADESGSLAERATAAGAATTVFKGSGTDQFGRLADRIATVVANAGDDARTADLSAEVDD